MITVTVGRPGQGKTVWLVGEVLRWSRTNKVYTNVAVKLPLTDSRAKNIFLISSLGEVAAIRPSKKEGSIKVVLDEVQVYLNSRNWDKLPFEFQLLLQQHRKRGIDIIGATQSIRRADAVFRELVQNFYEIRKVVSFRVNGSGFGFYYLREYDPDSIESATRSYDSLGWVLPFFADPFLYSVYDTTQEYADKPRNGRYEVLVQEVVPTIVEVKRTVSRTFKDVWEGVETPEVNQIKTRA